MSNKAAIALMLCRLARFTKASWTIDLHHCQSSYNRPQHFSDHKAVSLCLPHLSMCVHCTCPPLLFLFLLRQRRRFCLRHRHPRNRRETVHNQMFLATRPQTDVLSCLSHFSKVIEFRSFERHGLPKIFPRMSGFRPWLHHHVCPLSFQFCITTDLVLF